MQITWLALFFHFFTIVLGENELIFQADLVLSGIVGLSKTESCYTDSSGTHHATLFSEGDTDAKVVVWDEGFTGYLPYNFAGVISPHCHKRLPFLYFIRGNNLVSVSVTDMLNGAVPAREQNFGLPSGIYSKLFVSEVYAGFMNRAVLTIFYTDDNENNGLIVIPTMPYSGEPAEIYTISIGAVTDVTVSGDGMQLVILYADGSILTSPIALGEDAGQQVPGNLVLFADTQDISELANARALTTVLGDANSLYIGLSTAAAESLLVLRADLTALFPSDDGSTVIEQNNGIPSPFSEISRRLQAQSCSSLSIVASRDGSNIYLSCSLISSIEMFYRDSVSGALTWIGVLDDSISCLDLTPAPTIAPSSMPTFPLPTQMPSFNPTSSPTTSPTRNPTYYPTRNPTMNPTESPSMNPTRNPTRNPTESPSMNPTFSPTVSMNPTISFAPTNNPTANPTRNPTMNPTESPSMNPTFSPTVSMNPTISFAPTNNPTANPTRNPTMNPTGRPSSAPSNSPTSAPTNAPTDTPSHAPTFGPSGGPSKSPTVSPTHFQTLLPTIMPSHMPTPDPTLGIDTLAYFVAETSNSEMVGLTAMAAGFNSGISVIAGGLEEPTLFVVPAPLDAAYDSTPNMHVMMACPGPACSLCEAPFMKDIVSIDLDDTETLAFAVSTESESLMAFTIGNDICFTAAIADDTSPYLYYNSSALGGCGETHPVDIILSEPSGIAGWANNYYHLFDRNQQIVAAGTLAAGLPLEVQSLQLMEGCYDLWVDDCGTSAIGPYSWAFCGSSGGVGEYGRFCIDSSGACAENIGYPTPSSPTHAELCSHLDVTYETGDMGDNSVYVSISTTVGFFGGNGWEGTYLRIINSSDVEVDKVTSNNINDVVSTKLTKGQCYDIAADFCGFPFPKAFWVCGTGVFGIGEWRRFCLDDEGGCIPSTTEAEAHPFSCSYQENSIEDSNSETQHHRRLVAAGIFNPTECAEPAHLQNPTAVKVLDVQYICVSGSNSEPGNAVAVLSRTQGIQVLGHYSTGGLQPDSYQIRDPLMLLANSRLHRKLPMLQSCAEGRICPTDYSNALPSCGGTKLESFRNPFTLASTCDGYRRRLTGGSISIDTRIDHLLFMVACDDTSEIWFLNGNLDQTNGLGSGLDNEFAGVSDFVQLTIKPQETYGFAFVASMYSNTLAVIWLGFSFSGLDVAETFVYKSIDFSGVSGATDLLDGIQDLDIIEDHPDYGNILVVSSQTSNTISLFAIDSMDGSLNFIEWHGDNEPNPWAPTAKSDFDTISKIGIINGVNYTFPSRSPSDVNNYITVASRGNGHLNEFAVAEAIKTTTHTEFPTFAPSLQPSLSPTTSLAPSRYPSHVPTAAFPTMFPTYLTYVTPEPTVAPYAGLLEFIGSVATNAGPQSTTTYDDYIYVVGEDNGGSITLLLKSDDPYQLPTVIQTISGYPGCVLQGARNIAIIANGKAAIVASYGCDGLAAFIRDEASGMLTYDTFFKYTTLRNPIAVFNLKKMVAGFPTSFAVVTSDAIFVFTVPNYLDDYYSSGSYDMVYDSGSFAQNIISVDMFEDISAGAYNFAYVDSGMDDTATFQIMPRFLGAYYFDSLGPIPLMMSLSPASVRFDSSGMALFVTADVVVGGEMTGRLSVVRLDGLIPIYPASSEDNMDLLGVTSIVLDNVDHYFYGLSPQEGVLAVVAVDLGDLESNDYVGLTFIGSVRDSDNSNMNLVGSAAVSMSEDGEQIIVAANLANKISVFRRMNLLDICNNTLEAEAVRNISSIALDVGGDTIVTGSFATDSISLLKRKGGVRESALGQPIPPPDDIYAADVTYSTILLNWGPSMNTEFWFLSDNYAQADSYAVEMETVSSLERVVLTSNTGSSATSYLVEELEVNSAYKFSITAKSNNPAYMFDQAFSKSSFSSEIMTSDIYAEYSVNGVSINIHSESSFDPTMNCVIYEVVNVNYVYMSKYGESTATLQEKTDQLFGPGSACSISDSDSVAIDLAVGAGIFPNDAFAILAQSVSVVVTLNLPSSYPEVEAVLDYDDIISPCTDVDLDASLSQNVAGGSVYPAIYSWRFTSASSTSDGSGKPDLLNYLNSMAKTIIGPSMTIASGVIPAGTEVSGSVTVISAIFYNYDVAVFTFEVFSSPIPKIQFMEGNTLNAFVFDFIQLSLVIDTQSDECFAEMLEAAEEDGDEFVFTAAWHQLGVSPTLLGKDPQDSTSLQDYASADGMTLTFPQYLLGLNGIATDTPYEIYVQVSYFLLGVPYKIDAFADVYVQALDLIAIIDGGSRTASAASTSLPLNGEQSYDPNTCDAFSGSQCYLTYFWECRYLSDSSDCLGFFVPDAQVPYVAELNPSTAFQSDPTEAVITLTTYSLITGMSASANVVINIKDGNYGLVKTENLPRKVRQQTLYLGIEDESESEEQEAGSLAVGVLAKKAKARLMTATTTTDVSDRLTSSESQNGRSRGSLLLTLPPEILVPGESYTLELEGGIDLQDVVSITFDVNEPPYGGQIVVSPENIVALESYVTISATGYVDNNVDQYPLRYSFDVETYVLSKGFGLRDDILITHEIVFVPFQSAAISKSVVFGMNDAFNQGLNASSAMVVLGVRVMDSLGAIGGDTMPLLITARPFTGFLSDDKKFKPNGNVDPFIVNDNTLSFLTAAEEVMAILSITDSEINTLSQSALGSSSLGLELLWVRNTVQELYNSWVSGQSGGYFDPKDASDAKDDLAAALGDEMLANAVVDDLIQGPCLSPGLVRISDLVLTKLLPELWRRNSVSSEKFSVILSAIQFVSEASADCLQSIGYISGSSYNVGTTTETLVFSTAASAVAAGFEEAISGMTPADVTDTTICSSAQSILQIWLAQVGKAQDLYDLAMHLSDTTLDMSDDELVGSRLAAIAVEMNVLCSLSVIDPATEQSTLMSLSYALPAYFITKDDTTYSLTSSVQVLAGDEVMVSLVEEDEEEPTIYAIISDESTTQAKNNSEAADPVDVENIGLISTTWIDRSNKERITAVADFSLVTRALPAVKTSCNGWPGRSQATCSVSGSRVAVQGTSNEKKNKIGFKVANSYNAKEVKCEYVQPGSNVWSSDGCETSTESYGNSMTLVTCLCDHLTAFAVSTTFHVLSCSDLDGFASIYQEEGYALWITALLLAWVGVILFNVQWLSDKIQASSKTGKGGSIFNTTFFVATSFILAAVFRVTYFSLLLSAFAQGDNVACAEFGVKSDVTSDNGLATDTKTPIIIHDVFYPIFLMAFNIVVLYWWDLNNSMRESLAKMKGTRFLKKQTLIFLLVVTMLMLVLFVFMAVGLYADDSVSEEKEQRRDADAGSVQISFFIAICVAEAIAFFKIGSLIVEAGGGKEKMGKIYTVLRFSSATFMLLAVVLILIIIPGVLSSPAAAMFLYSILLHAVELLAVCGMVSMLLGPGKDGNTGIFSSISSTIRSSFSRKSITSSTESQSNLSKTKSAKTLSTSTATTPTPGATASRDKTISFVQSTFDMDKEEYVSSDQKRKANEDAERAKQGSRPATTSSTVATTEFGERKTMEGKDIEMASARRKE